MAPNKEYFRGKKTNDLDVMLQNSDSNFPNRKYGKIDSVLLSTKQVIWNYQQAANSYKYPFTTNKDGVEYYLTCTDATADQLVTVTVLNAAGEQVQIPMMLQGQSVLPIRLILAEAMLLKRHQTSSLWATKANPMAGDVYIFEGGVATAGVPTDVTTVRGFIKNSAVGVRENRTQQGIYTIPLTHYGFFTKINTFFIKKQAAVTLIELELSFPFGNGTPQDLTDFPANQSDNFLFATASMTTIKPDFDRDFRMSEPIPPGTDIIFSQNSDTAAAGIAVDYDVFLVKKEFFGVGS